MDNITQAFRIAKIRADVRMKHFTDRFGVTEATIRYVANGRLKTPDIRKYIEEFCEKHAKEDYIHCLSKGSKSTDPYAKKPASLCEEPCAHPQKSREVA